MGFNVPYKAVALRKVQVTYAQIGFRVTELYCHKQW